MATIDDVKNMIERNEVKNAIAQLDVMIELCPELDELYYLRGNAYRKFNSWKNALNDYCKAISLNPDSPAVEAYRASLEILEFFNKDMLTPKLIGMHNWPSRSISPAAIISLWLADGISLPTSSDNVFDQPRVRLLTLTLTNPLTIGDKRHNAL